MKYCPICDERYDEEIIRFCTKDGTPLIDEVQPSFTALPSENAEDPETDFGEETIIRRKPETGAVSPDPKERSERIVIPTSQPAEQQVRPRTTQAYYPPPQPPNTGKIVALTIAGTLVVLSFGAGLFWLLQKESPTNTNINTNPININANLSTNSGFNSNFNFNTNSNANYGSNYNFNMNLNSNLKSPSPTPRTSPTPSPSPSASPSQSSTPRPAANLRPSNTARPIISPTPRTGPRPPAFTTNRPSGNGN